HVTDLSGQEGRRQCRGGRHVDGRCSELAARPPRSGTPETGGSVRRPAACNALVRGSGGRDQLQPHRCQSTDTRGNRRDRRSRKILPRCIKYCSIAPCKTVCFSRSLVAEEGRMRLLGWVVVIVVIVGAGAGIYMLTPVNGPERDLTLAGDAERGE